MYATCPQCGQTYDLGARVAGKIVSFFVVASTTGAVAVHQKAGQRRSRRGSANVATTLLLGTGASVLATLLGHLIDRYILPECPTCRVVLQAADDVLAAYSTAASPQEGA